MLDIMDKLEKWVQPFKDFVVKNHGNPVFWVAAFVIGIALFSFTYNSLNKD